MVSIEPQETSALPAPALPGTTPALLTAPILPALLRFALPNMVAMVATALATVAETAYVGRFGVPSLAGMALVFPMIMLQMMLSGGAMGGGVAAAISRALGAGAPQRANALAVHALWIGLAAGCLNGLLMLAWGPAIYAGLGGRGEALAQAIAFSNVAFCGSLGVWLMNTFASVLRGAGNMLVPSATFLLVSLAQVLIGGALGLGWGPLPRLGMPGVAAGQVIAFSAGAAFLFCYLRSSRSKVRLAVGATPLQRSLLADILKVGALACISPLQTVLTVLILTRLVSQFGATALAGYGIGVRLEFLLVPVTFAIGVASVPLVGMAIGAGRAARAKRVAWIAGLLTMAVLGVLGGAVALKPGLWVGLFTMDRAVHASASLYLQWAGPVYGLFGLGLCLYFSALGAGKVGGLVLAGTLRLLVVAVGGWALLQASAEPWTVFALVALGMAVFGLAAALAVRLTRWGAGDKRQPASQ
jgi:Na+-driven multidrug efflux pump